MQRLVPPAHEHEPPEVVVAQDPEPLPPVDAGAGVDILEYLLPLAGDVRNSVHTSAALDVDATPIKVVSHVEDVIWRADDCPLRHLIGNVALGTIISAPHEVPLVAGELRRPVVRGGWGPHRRVPAEGARQAAPVADEVHVKVAVGAPWLREAGVRKLGTVVVRGQLRHRRDLEPGGAALPALKRRRRSGQVHRRLRDVALVGGDARRQSQLRVGLVDLDLSVLVFHLVAARGVGVAL
mmetsp:Transcript_117066/g.313865  ORF Transcript_117066/g.313865 Transcript_117066/m.313865 type:complete len:238 (+) Transcript_117066:428-1141(+)